jgi:hypothetical protein
MTSSILSYCKVKEGSKLLEFGITADHFNNATGQEVYTAEVRRQLTDSIEIYIEQKGKVGQIIEQFKLSNQSLVTWDDYWISKEENTIIDPKIRHMNLQRNSLLYVNMNTPRLELVTLNLEGNFDLEHLYIHEAPKLERIDLSECKSLKYVSMGLNKSIKELIAKDCNMSPVVMEQLLRDFTPVFTASANLRGAGAFRKRHETLLDLRGNVIDWENRKIASKIRLLLVNNWVVKWDNNPPYDIVPPQMYGVFVESHIDL